VLKVPLNPNHPNEGNGTANGGKGKKQTGRREGNFRRGEWRVKREWSVRIMLSDPQVMQDTSDMFAACNVA